MNIKKSFIILVGNIGAGKTHLAEKFSKEGLIHVDIDKIGMSLEGEISAQSLSDSVNKIFIDLIDNNESIVMDGNFLTVMGRKFFCTYSKQKGYKVICYDFGPGDEHQLMRRVKNNLEKKESEWRLLFQHKFNEYETPTKNEPIDEIIEI